MGLDCTQTREYLHGYLDRELDPVTATAIEQHLQSCATCEQAYAEQKSLQTVVRQHAAYYAAPDALAQRIRGRVSAGAGKSALEKILPRGQWLQLGAAVAATAVVTWIAAVQLGSPSREDIIAEQVYAGHVRSEVTNRIADVATSDQHTVKPWLSSRLDFSPPVTDLTSAGYPLVGGRIDYLDNRPVAALIYRHRLHLINLFVWPDAKAGRTTALRSLSKQGYNILHWSDAGMTFWAISDLNPAEIRTFAETFSQQAASSTK